MSMKISLDSSDLSKQTQMNRSELFINFAKLTLLPQYLQEHQPPVM